MLPFAVLTLFTGYKRQVITVLGLAFPEYEQLFSDVFGQSSKIFLEIYGTPDQVVDVNTRSLACTLRKASKVASV